MGLVLMLQGAGLTGCATNAKKIAVGMLAGAAVGAAVGNQMSSQTENREEATRNTIISSMVFSLITGGALSWHYQEIENVKVEISGRFARYQLCNPDELPADLAQQLQFNQDSTANFYPMKRSDVGKLAISLDDNTKWAYPTFRKRYLQPEGGETQIILGRYIWEIIKPGQFVTRSQNPQFFVEEAPESKP